MKSALMPDSRCLCRSTNRLADSAQVSTSRQPKPDWSVRFHTSRMIDSTMAGSPCRLYSAHAIRYIS